MQSPLNWYILKWKFPTFILNGVLILFDMLDSLTLSLVFLCKYEKGFSGYPVVGVEGH